MDRFDLLVIGGGINGAAIARDAAGRGLSVLLVEKDDLAAHTSSASSKLIHGGLRYLELYDFRLVRESLREREFLLQTAPHIVRPLRFILPDPPGGRPWWLIRLGLMTYDLLAGRSSLPRARAVRRDDAQVRGALKSDGFRLAAYWDAWVDDARLVVLNALDAAERGAEIATRTECLSARRDGDFWRAALSDGREVEARIIVNATGAWVTDTLSRLETAAGSGVRLVKGSHIVLPRLWDGAHAYILQQADGRIVFALPYGDYSLVGTTDIPVARPDEARISDEEIRYLCEAANFYFSKRSEPGDVIWSYSGIRALHDDGAAHAKDVTREHHLELHPAPGLKLLSVFGGKITTARAVAAEALDRLGFADRLKFTATTPLPGGDIDLEFNRRLEALGRWMPGDLLHRLATSYGTRLDRLIGDADSMAALGRHYGNGLHEAELRYLIQEEFARTAEDILWRRTKLGLQMTEAQVRSIDQRLANPQA